MSVPIGVPFGLLQACEAMFQINVLCRAKKNPYHDLSYELKNELIRLLYEHGYCIEAQLHHQDFPCWSCGGTGEYYRGVTCYKCDGTGVYRRIWHYAFRFQVGDRRFSWHQPKHMVDYPVETKTDTRPYHDPQLAKKDDLDRFYKRVGQAIWTVSVFLWLHRRLPEVELTEMPYARELSWDLYRLKHRYISHPLMTIRRRWLGRLNILDDEDVPF
jgi:hypothetical protein